MPAVSVLVASYNYRAFLGQTLDSILAQTWQDMEVLVIDDGSTDGSLELAADYAARDARLRLIRHPDGGNHGLPATLVRGLAEARGEWTAFLESDDIWQPDCLERRMQTLADFTHGAHGRGTLTNEGAIQTKRSTAAGAGEQAGERVGLERNGTGGLPDVPHPAPSERVDLIFNNIEPLPMPGAGTAWFDAYVGRVMREHATHAELAAAIAANLDDSNLDAAGATADANASNGASNDASNTPTSATAPTDAPAATAGENITPAPAEVPTVTPGAWRIGSALLTENKIPTFSCVQVRTDVLRGCSFDSPVPRWLDWWLWIQLAQRPCLFVPQKCTIWRLHAGSQHHGVSPRAYLRDQRALWLGLRRLPLHTDAAGERLLRQPWWAHLVSRLALFVREHGLLGTLRRIGARLRPAR